MISKFTPEFDLSDPTNGTTSNEYVITGISFKDGIQMHIPKFIQNMPAGAPKTQNFRLSNNIFANKNNTKPNFTSMTLKEQNYLTGVFGNTEDDLLKIIQYRPRPDGKTTDLVIPQGTQLRCTFMNGKISRLQLEVDILDQPYKTAKAEGYEKIEDLISTTRPYSMKIMVNGETQNVNVELTSKNVINATKGDHNVPKSNPNAYYDYDFMIDQMTEMVTKEKTIEGGIEVESP